MNSRIKDNQSLADLIGTVEYDWQWTARFEREQGPIESAPGGLVIDIQHTVIGDQFMNRLNQWKICRGIC